MEAELALGAGARTGCSWPTLSWTSRRWTGGEEDEEEGCHMRRLSPPFLEELSSSSYGPSEGCLGLLWGSLEGPSGSSEAVLRPLGPSWGSFGLS